MSAGRGRPPNTSQTVVLVLVVVALFTGVLVLCSWTVSS